MNNKAKMLRKKKGHCPVSGHSDWCDVAGEIQEGNAESAKAKEKRDWKKEAEEEKQDLAL